MPNDYLIGTGIYDVTGPAAELGMMGMASIEQKTEGIQSRLFARAFIVCDSTSNKRVVIFICRYLVLHTSSKNGSCKKTQKHLWK